MLRHTVITTAGQMRVRPLVRADTDLLHGWVTHPRAAFWDELDSTPEDVEAEIARLAGSSHEAGWIIQRGDTPLALIEVYDPSAVLLAGRPEVAEGDVGMHLLCATPPAGAHEPGLTSALMAAAVAWIFDAPEASAVIGGEEVQRILVEPDVRNAKILAKNTLAGFSTIPGAECVALPGKQARLQQVTRGGFCCSPLGARAHVTAPPARTEHLDRPGVERVQRNLLAKALRELIHERLVAPEPCPGSDGTYRVDLGGHRIRFSARVHPLEHYSIDPASLAAEGGLPDLVDLVASAAPELGIPPEFTHTYLEELSATTAGRARAAAYARPTSGELADAAEALSPAEYLQYIESAMVEGHPGFIANSGRAGMGEADLTAYAPELGRSTQLVWLAARRDCTGVASTRGTDVDALFSSQLPGWQEVLRARGLDPKRYVPFPVHPWQWENRITTVFAHSLARRDLVLIGPGPDLMHPQQSLRTFFNLSRPELPYVKTAVAVRNMGFTRGLSPAYMSDTPAISEWLGSVLDDDEDFRRHNVRLLKEIASVGFTGDVYHASAATGAASSSPHMKMLAALWRDSPVPQLGDASVAVTLAAVLHTDADGNPLVAEWIRRSALPAIEWVRALLSVYLRPAIRALAEYDIVFMPHSENVILELTGGVPTGSFFKDLGEEVAVLRAERSLPDAVARIQGDRGDYDDEQRALAIHADIFDGVLRHLGALLSDAGLVDDEAFWAAVRECVEGYWADYPDSGRDLPLLSDTFRHSCLNRLQLRNPETMVTLDDQNSSLLYAGRISNPAARAGRSEERR